MLELCSNYYAQCLLVLYSNFEVHFVLIISFTDALREDCQCIVVVRWTGQLPLGVACVIRFPFQGKKCLVATRQPYLQGILLDIDHTSLTPRPGWRSLEVAWEQGYSHELPVGVSETFWNSPLLGCASCVCLFPEKCYVYINASRYKPQCNMQPSWQGNIAFLACYYV